MDIYQQQQTISGVVNTIDRYDMRPTYQRGSVWSLEKKQLLIDTILRNYDMPKFYFRKVEKRGPIEFEVVDGQQRLTACAEFFENKFATGEISEDLDVSNDLSGKKFEDLPIEYTNIFLNFNISTAQLVNASELEVREIFRRLQEGSTLNPQEKRNALTGNMRDFIKYLANQHPCFAKTSISNKRMEHDDLAALVTCIEINGGPIDVSAKSLFKMYNQKAKFDTSSATAKKIKRVLNVLGKVLDVTVPEMDIKWGFVDFYLLISNLSENFVLDGREADLRDFYINFEAERRSNDDDIALANSSNPWDQDMSRYWRAFRSGGMTKDSIETRRSVYERRLHKHLPNLTLRDQKRLFSRDERIAIWRRDGEKCVNCNCQISFDNMEADHNFAWSKGGVTSLENAQSLCVSCNRAKSAS